MSISNPFCLTILIRSDPDRYTPTLDHISVQVLPGISVGYKSRGRYKIQFPHGHMRVQNGVCSVSEGRLSTATVAEDQFGIHLDACRDANPKFPDLDSRTRVIRYSCEQGQEFEIKAYDQNWSLLSYCHYHLVDDKGFKQNGLLILKPGIAISFKYKDTIRYIYGLGTPYFEKVKGELKGVGVYVTSKRLSVGWYDSFNTFENHDEEHDDIENKNDNTPTDDGFFVKLDRKKKPSIIERFKRFVLG